MCVGVAVLLHTLQILTLYPLHSTVHSAFFLVDNEWCWVKILPVESRGESLRGEPELRGRGGYITVEMECGG